MIGYTFRGLILCRLCLIIMSYYVLIFNTTSLLIGEVTASNMILFYCMYNSFLVPSRILCPLSLPPLANTHVDLQHFCLFFGDFVVLSIILI